MKNYIIQNKTQIIAAFIVISYGLTLGLAYQQQNFQTESQVNSLIDEKQQPIIDEFDNVVQTINGDIDNVNSTAEQAVASNEDLNETVQELREDKQELENETEKLEQELNESQEKLQELRSWASNFEMLETNSSVENEVVTADVMNKGFSDVSGVLVEFEFTNSTEATVVGSVPSGESMKVTQAVPTNQTFVGVTAE